MQYLTKILILVFISFLGNYTYSASEESLLLGKTLSQTKQQQMTPKQALQRLKEGNQRFLSNQQLTRDYLKQAHQSSFGQYPFAVILNCMDSRSVPEFFFDQGLADLFTLRVAGNVLNDDNLGSMEYATKVTGARLIVVLAHTSCGAVAGACDGVQLGHLTDVLHKIEPVVQPSMQEQGTKNCSDSKLIDAIAKANALRVVKEIQERSPIIQDLINKKQIGIVAGLHDIKTGQVHFFEEKRSIPD
ncbi:carbonic anhydrase family protein [Legionella longbeachae]|uniref:Putative carbonic anhydrase n=1 Tax=Legionella longbeachae serogroup 1 (strain NSW150) TaxID=661367 RepID=D3HKK7_LEGLN|nr:carbonic anhydrase family protein [Legionella longbeachae]VEE03490.1 carbonic anhydrase [Legionella oakridgensis]HBD7397767.1 carbonic anhydrase [Legionella pneumophila]ARB93618.1 carbonic anhydrase [Legionella longbeachae]ARM33241.1 carbonic anhydrase [Legionella longbeachae]EEZ93899.1 putative carbonic anhydrase [Legionella longbeachae D-4968]